MELIKEYKEKLQNKSRKLQKDIQIKNEQIRDYRKQNEKMEQKIASLESETLAKESALAKKSTQ